MTPERSQRVYAVFEAVLKCDAAERAALLKERCAGDPELRAEVERLLAADAQAQRDRFLASLASTERDVPRPETSPDEKSKFYWSQSPGGTNDADPITATSLPAVLAEHPDYLIKRELGRGGMGVVYLAENRLLGRQEVLKVIGREIMERPGVVERFLREIRAVAELRHPNIVTAYHASRLGDSIVFAMEYVDGLDLSRMVKARGPLPVSNACSYIHQAALGLEHAHEQGMVHRDIKPSNLMLARQGNRAIIKVLDFGLAMVKSEGMIDGGLTHEGQLLGTPDYVAPEQTIDARNADIRADIYSLGCTLYYLLAGGTPFQASSLYELLQAHHSMDAMPLNLLRPAVPIEVAAIAAKMMAKQPKRRFQTPKEVAQALKPFFKSGSDRVAAGNPDITRAGQPDRSSRSASFEISTLQPPSPGTGTHASQMKNAKAPSDGSLIVEGPFGAEEFEPVFDMAVVDSEATHGIPSWLWPSMAIAVLLMGIAAAWMSRVAVVRRGNGGRVDQKVPIDSGRAIKPTVKARQSAPAATSVEGEAPSRKVAPPGVETVGPPGTLQLTKGSGVEPRGKQPGDGSPGVSAASNAVNSEQAPAVESTSRTQTGSQPNSSTREAGFVSLFNGQDLTGWNFHPARFPAWNVDNGTIVGRSAARGHLYTVNDDYTNFQVRVEVQIKGEGKARFCFRLPSIVNGELRGSGYEANIDATGKIGSLVGFDNPGQFKTAMAPQNDWFFLEVIALGREIIVKVNERTTFEMYDHTGRNHSRGHFALRQIGASAEVRFRRLEVKVLDLGNDPAEVAAGAQPRSFVTRSFNRKQYVVFPQELSWVEARNRCRKLGGRLALPINEGENQFLTKLAKDTQMNGAWLGASDTNFHGVWRSVDNSELEYLNWDQELLGPIDERSKEHYPILLVERDGKWAYQPVVSLQYHPGYICQWD